MKRFLHRRFIVRTSTFGTMLVASLVVFGSPAGVQALASLGIEFTSHVGGPESSVERHCAASGSLLRPSSENRLGSQAHR